MDKPTGSAERTALYRFYAADGILLYVGITKRPGTRWGEHAKMQPWWPLVDRQTVQWLSGREEALAAEKIAITDEKPLFNIVGASREEVPLDEDTGFPVSQKRVRRSRPQRHDELPSVYHGDGWHWPHERVAERIKGAIRSHEYASGDRLPSCRSIADEAGVSTHTVVAALRLLREQGLVCTRDRLGTFVAARAVE